MRTIDTAKLKSVRQRLEGVNKNLVRELYYSIEDFFRVSAPIDEIIAHIRIALNMLKTISKKDDTLLVLSRQTSTHRKSGTLIPTSTLLCLAYPHQLFNLEKILDILEPYEVTLSRLERTGRDILLCRITQNDKALSVEEKNGLIKRIKMLAKKESKDKSKLQIT